MGVEFSRRARVLLAGVATSVLVSGGLIWSATSSFAVHDNGMFELDGNIAQDAATAPPYDWASLFDASGNRIVAPDPNNGPLLADSFASDSATPDASYFASNKDSDTIGTGGWGCTTINNPTPKDDLLNAYAALIQVPANATDNAGHNVLYLGSERGTNNGDSFAGFWLLKNNHVGCSGSGDFSGAHTDGDILVVSNFTNGGGTQDVQVYRWTGDNVTGSPVLQASFNGSKCGGATNDNVCAIANTDTITSPWAPTSHDSSTFVEAGLDMNVLLGQDGGCFTTFMAETRSSQEITATLKDYAMGQFNTCPPPPITTTATPGGSVVAPGTAQHDVATVAAVGNRPTPTGTLTFFLCGPADVSSDGCDSGDGTQVGDPVTLLNGAANSDPVDGTTTPNDTAPGTYCWRAEYAPDTDAQPFYLPSAETNHGTECFRIQHGDPTLSTTISVSGDDANSVGLTTIGDSATLANFVSSTDGEQITFKLFGPYADGVTPDCTGDPVFTTTSPLTGGAASIPSDSFSPTDPGTYVWVASYAGDTFNSPAAEPCNQAAEKVTINGALVGIVKTADPGGPVSGGDQIGFDITVSNTLAGTATDVTVTDDLPAGAGNDLNWSLVPAYEGCEIDGSVGTQVLNCDLGDVTGNSSLPLIHLVATTTITDCGTVENTATVDSTNAGSNDSTASVDVQCTTIGITKTADASAVASGTQIGFTVTVTNATEILAAGVALNDPLPAGSGVNWSIDGAANGCAVTGAVGSQVLACAIGDLAAGGSVSVHVVSATTAQSCQLYVNVASVSAANAPAESARATTNVICALPISVPPSKTPLAITGAGPVQGEFYGALALIAVGMVLLIAGASRRKRAH